LKKFYFGLFLIVSFLLTQNVLLSNSPKRQFPLNDISVAASFGEGSLGNQVY